MIPSLAGRLFPGRTVYQRGVVIDSQQVDEMTDAIISISKGSGD